jgi:CcmD family protein
MKEDRSMQGVSYLVAAYIIAWVGLFAYLAFLTFRIRSVRTELAAVEELVREQNERTEKRDI